MKSKIKKLIFYSPMITFFLKSLHSLLSSLSPVPLYVLGGSARVLSNLVGEIMRHGGDVRLI